MPKQAFSLNSFCVSQKLLWQLNIYQGYFLIFELEDIFKFDFLLLLKKFSFKTNKDGDFQTS